MSLVMPAYSPQSTTWPITCNLCWTKGNWTWQEYSPKRLLIYSRLLPPKKSILTLLREGGRLFRLWILRVGINSANARLDWLIPVHRTSGRIRIIMWLLCCWRMEIFQFLEKMCPHSSKENYLTRSWLPWGIDIFAQKFILNNIINFNYLSFMFRYLISSNYLVQITVFNLIECFKYAFND